MATFSAKVTNFSILEAGADEDIKTSVNKNTEEELYKDDTERGEKNEESQNGNIPFFKKPLFLGILGFSAVALFSLIFFFTRGGGTNASNVSSVSNLKSGHTAAKASVSTATKASFASSIIKRPFVLASVVGVVFLALGIILYFTVFRKKDNKIIDVINEEPPGWFDLKSTKSLILVGALSILALFFSIVLVGYWKGWSFKVMLLVLFLILFLLYIASNYLDLSGVIAWWPKFDLGIIKRVNSLIDYLYKKDTI